MKFIEYWHRKVEICMVIRYKTKEITINEYFSNISIYNIFHFQNLTKFNITFFNLKLKVMLK